jgi:SAM-dependent methyltransferase
MSTTLPPPPPLTARGTLRWAVVGPIVETLAPGSVLELGCGQGAAGARLARLGAYTGVEPDEQSCAVARARIEPLGGTVVHGDHTALPADSRYDLVCAFEVLEHLEDDAGVLRAWLARAAPGAHLVVSVPAWPDRFGPSDDLVGHFRRYTPASLTALLEGAGCTDVRTRLYGWPLGYLLEAVSNRVAARRLGAAPRSVEERSATSGRFLQPARSATALRVGTAPFRLLQGAVPGRGIGLVAVARIP